MIPNGGFPPIKRCLDQNKILKKEKSKKSKEKKPGFFIASNNNINIRSILKDSSKNPIIDIRNKDDELDVVDSL